MRGLELARYCYDYGGRQVLEEQFPSLLSRMAIGLVGEGSECFGFDDELSRDHDWGPAFCIWLDKADFRQFGTQVQAVYDSLHMKIPGYPVRQNGIYSTGRVGCLCMQDWYIRYTGSSEGPQTLLQWLRVPESFLATATNGEVFYDPQQHFSTIRNRLLNFYPEDVRIKKIVARAAVMSQAGQYNVPRCLRRGDMITSWLAMSEFFKAVMSMAYLLNRQYAPYYKWMFRGLQSLPKLPRLRAQLESLRATETAAAIEEQIDGICLNTLAELQRQELTDGSDSFLQEHCEAMMRRIRDPQLRQMHWMEG